MAAATLVVRMDFWRLIPRRSLLAFLGAVFFTFAPVGLMFVSSFADDRPAGPVLFYAFLSGAVAVCWAAAFTVSRWFIVGIVGLNLALAALAGPFVESPLGLRSARPSAAGFAVAAAIALGYMLFLRFIGGQGRRTERLVTEMALAGRMHEMLVPPIAFANARMEALGTSVPSSEMGGDLLDLAEEGEDVDLFVGDVSGHGVAAGLVLGMLKSAIHTSLLARRPLDELAAALNEVLERLTRPEVFATLVALRVQADGNVACVLAGHHPVLHWCAATQKLHRVENRSLALGMLARQRYAARTIATGPGDLLAVYTDGLNETFDGSERELGHDALERVIADRASRPLVDIRRAVFELAEGHGPQVDDRTLLLVRFRALDRPQHGPGTDP